jgi:Kef-type K+ transport system membrane component KefB
MQTVFFEITVIVVLAAVVSIVFKVLKQPAILAYIFTGLLITATGIIDISNGDALESLAKIGITLLLFMLGLEIQINELRSVGKTSLITGIGQIVFTSAIGFFICKLFGFSNLSALYASIALTFSSTIIIVKLLSDKKDINSLYGKISVGFLLVQDFFAIIALILLASISSFGETSSVYTIATIFIKVVILFGGVLYLSKAVFPKIVHKISGSQEILLLASLGWALGLAAFVSSPIIGFSVEIGGFLAGLSLANSSESFQIATKIKSIRDFFIMIFFVILGMTLKFGDIGDALVPALLLSVFVLIGNPFIVMILLGLLGYTKRVGFLSGLTVAQISEFSLIVIILGNSLGHVPDNVVSIITLVGIITFTLSTYAILNGKLIYERIKTPLGIFERKILKETIEDSNGKEGHIVLVGAHRLGVAFLEDLKDSKKDIIVVDFNPDIVEKLKSKGYNVIYGDIADVDIQDKVNIEKAKMVISSIPDLEDNILFLSKLKTFKPRPVSIIVARFPEDKKPLKDSGADIVILPHRIIGKTLANVVKTGSTEILSLNKAGIKNVISSNFSEKVNT